MFNALKTWWYTKRLRSSKNYDNRRFAAESLGKLGDANSVGLLIETLSDENHWVRQAAAQALGVLGDRRAVEPLITALIEGNDGAGEALGKLGDPRAVEPLIAALDYGAEGYHGSFYDLDKHLPWAAANSLGQLGDTPRSRTAYRKTWDLGAPGPAHRGSGSARLGEAKWEPMIQGTEEDLRDFPDYEIHALLRS